jgi:hypothetical protein
MKHVLYLFISQAAIADFAVLFFEAIPLEPLHLLPSRGSAALSSPCGVGHRALQAIASLRAMCDGALWRDVQSRFIQVR